MHTLIEWFNRLRDVQSLVQTAGYAGLTALIFAETGLFIGFFLPGDSVMVSAGLFAQRGYLSIGLLGSLLTAASIVGDSTGYWIGRATGPRMFRREDSLLFKRRHLIAAHQFYERHGGKAVIIARFMPVIRAFAPVVAGIGEMPYSRYVMYSIAGSVLWVWSMLLLGYSLGRYVPGVASHIDIVVVLIVLVSVAPALIARLNARRKA
jgi:membrane-associated protein